MPPTLANGKICYIEIPSLDVRRSAEFYGRVFGWRIRQRGDGSTAFDDGVGEVSGTWVIGRTPAATPGFMVYIGNSGGVTSASFTVSPNPPPASRHGGRDPRGEPSAAMLGVPWSPRAVHTGTPSGAHRAAPAAFRRWA